MRKAESKHLNEIFIERWSPRSFKNTPVETEKLETLFEAARWAPSCFNDQPWLFLYAETKEEDKNLYLKTLVEANQKWAKEAPVLALVFARKNFSSRDSENAWAEFDTGSAFMSLIMQAHMLGLSCHGMGGFNKEKAFEVTGVPSDKYHSICALAIGYKGSPDKLEDDFKENEKPNDRKPLSSVFMKETFKES